MARLAVARPVVKSTALELPLPFVRADCRAQTLNIMGFKYSFEYFRMGQSAVILVVLFLVVYACSLGIMRLRTASEY